MASFPLRLEQYELLSDIQEIRGLLRIEGWRGVSFPYLRNLKIIGSQNGTKFTATCGTEMKRKGGSCCQGWLMRVKATLRSLLTLESPTSCVMFDLTLWLECW